MSHGAARQTIAKTFTNSNNPSRHFEVYLHETSEKTEIRRGIDSQKLINADALGHDVFILYAGDRIGMLTVAEFRNFIDNKPPFSKFIYVLHHKGEDVNDEGAPERYMSWKEFYAKHMSNLPEEVKYEVEVKGENGLEAAVRRICDRVTNMTLTQMSPSDLEYDTFLVNQSDYRKSGPVYFTRDIDRELAMKVANGFKPLTIIEGPSLSGKTRAVVNALKSLGDSSMIHFLHARSQRANEIFVNLNVEWQFPEGIHSVLVIDEIDLLLLSADGETVVSSAVINKFDEICRMACEQPSRLNIVTMTNIHSEDLLRPLIRVNRPAPWLSRDDNRDILTIPSLSLNEMHDIFRILRSRNLVNSKDVKQLHSGMPIGALFVDMDVIRQKHTSLVGQPGKENDYSRLFDAIKMIYLWKRSSRTDFALLRRFFNFIYSTELSTDQLCALLEESESLVTVARVYPENARGRAARIPVYSYHADEIIVERIFRFIGQKEELPSDQELVSAIELITDFILTTPDTPGDSSEKFRDLATLYTRVQPRFNDPARYNEVLLWAFRQTPVETLIPTHEYHSTIDGTQQDWVDTWLTCWAEERLASHNEADVLAIYDRRPSAPLLAKILACRRNRQDSIDISLSLIVDDNGALRDNCYPPTYFALTRELTAMMDIRQALEWFDKCDFDNAVIKSCSDKHHADPDDIAARTVKLASNVFKEILCKVSSTEELEMAMATLDIVNTRRVQNGLCPLYSDEASKYFAFIRAHTWKCIASSLPSAQVIVPFRQLLSTDIPQEDSQTSKMTLSKAMALNSMLLPMPTSDAMECWDKMGNLRDSYTLRTILEQAADFATAKGIFEEFLSSTGSGMRVNDILLNSLLKKAHDKADIADAEESFRRFGLLDNDMEIYDIPDNYTMGTLLAVPKLKYQERIEIARRHKKLDVPRTIKTIGPLLEKAPDYATIKRILFSDTLPDYLTATERAMLQESPLVISWLFRKVKNQKEADDARKLLKKLITQWKRDDMLSETIGDTDGNINSELIRNEFIFPSYKEATDYLQALEANGIDYAHTLYLQRHLAVKFIDETCVDADTPAAIDFVNQLLMDFIDAPRKEVWKAVELRCCMRHHTGDWKAPIDLNAVEPFPLIKAEGEWCIREVSKNGFFLNMLQHRFVHPKTLCRILCLKGSQLQREADPTERQRVTVEIRNIITIAIESKTYLNHIGYLAANRSLRPFGINLIDVSQYSIIPEVSSLMASGHITPREAEERISEFEKDNNLTVYRSQSFYDACVRCMANKRVADAHHRMEVSDILAYIGNLPARIKFSEEMFLHTLQAARNLTEIIQAEKAYGNYLAVPNRFKKVMLSIKEIPYDERNQIIAYAIGYDRAKADIQPDGSISDTLTAALLSRFEMLDLDSVIDIIYRHHLKVLEPAVFNLLYRVETPQQYERLLPLFPDGHLTANLLYPLLIRLYDNSTRMIRENLFDYFYAESFIIEWNGILKEAPHEDYIKLKKLLNFWQSCRGQYDTRRRLGNFADYILDPRLLDDQD